MKSKAGDKVCCGCDTNFSVKKDKPPTHKTNHRARSRSNSLSKERPKSKTYGETIERKEKDVKKQSVGELEVRNRIGIKAMEFLEGRLDKAIEDNNLEVVERILNMVSKAADLTNWSIYVGSLVLMHQQYSTLIYIIYISCHEGIADVISYELVVLFDHEWAQDQRRRS